MSSGDKRYKLAWLTKKVRIGVIGAYASGKTTFIRSLSEIFDTIATRRYVDEVGVYNSTLAYDYGVLYAARDTGRIVKICDEEAVKRIDEGHPHVYRVELWGAAGQRHLYAARQAIVYPKIDGVILFFDPSREDSLELSVFLYREAKENIAGLGETKPIVVVFNKIDLVDEWEARKLAERVVRFLDEEYVEGENLFFISVKEKRGIWLPVEAFIRAYDSV